MRPAWLEGRPATALAPCTCCRPGRRRQAFLERTLRDLSAFFSREMTGERGSSAGGYLRALDPRVKILGGLAAVVLVSFLRGPLALLGMVVVVHALAVSSRAGTRAFLLRVWVPALVFGGVLALPVVFNVFIPGTPLVTVWSFRGPVSLGPLRIPAAVSVTSQGALSVLTLTLRIAATLGVVTLLVLTTRRNEIIMALRVLGIPQAFIFTLGVTYRYIHLFATLVENRHQAKMSRVLVEPDTRRGQMAEASSAGTLLEKFLTLSDQVHDAMISRGFSPNGLTPPTWRASLRPLPGMSGSPRMDRTSGRRGRMPSPPEGPRAL